MNSYENFLFPDSSFITGLIPPTKSKYVISGWKVTLYESGNLPSIYFDFPVPGAPYTILFSPVVFLAFIEGAIVGDVVGAIVGDVNKL